MEHKRLTNEELNDFTSRVVVQLEPTLTQQVMSLILELTEYRTKIENGTLIELPCKVGDAIYIVGDKIKEFIVTAVSIDTTEYYDWEMGCIQFADKNGHRKFYYSVCFSWIGKRVFFDKSEAEKKLEELKDDKI